MPSRRLELGWVEDPEVLADDFVGGVTLAALCPRVPGGHPAVRVEHEDRIVADGLDQEPEPLLAPQQRFLLLTAARDVAGDLREADVVAVRVVYRGDHDVGPELRPVLADPPALLLVVTIAQRPGELLLGVAPVLLRLRVERTEVPADDLLLGVALDPLGSGVPALDQALRGEHEDRVVLDLLDQQSEADLTASQLLLGTALAADVLHLEEEVERSLAAVEHGGEGGEHRARTAGVADLVLELHHPGLTIEDLGQRVGDQVAATRGEAGVRRTDELADGTPEEVGEGAVRAHDLSGEGHRRHPDRGVLEDLPEALEVLAEHRAVGVVRRPRRRGRLRRRGCRRALGEDGEQVVGERVERGVLLQEGRGPQLAGPVGEALALEAAVHHHAGVGRRLEDPGQRLEPVHPGHRHVQEEHRRPVRAYGVDRLGAVRALTDDVELPGQPEAGAHECPHLSRVVHDDDRRKAWLPSISPSHARNLTHGDSRCRPSRLSPCGRTPARRTTGRSRSSGHRSPSAGTAG
jgi:hypothetical protein